TSKLTQLEYENKRLHEYVQRLEHPGTAPLASILKYPHSKQLSVEKKPQNRPKNFKFGTLVTAESIVKELEDRENVKQKKAEDARLRKERRAINKTNKQAQNNAKNK
ncbi:35097_t:CDS:1, partial [Racocetra persica]